MNRTQDNYSVITWLSSNSQAFVLLTFELPIMVIERDEKNYVERIQQN